MSLLTNRFFIICSMLGLLIAIYLVSVCASRVVGLSDLIEQAEVENQVNNDIVRDFIELSLEPTSLYQTVAKSLSSNSNKHKSNFSFQMECLILSAYLKIRYSKDQIFTLYAVRFNNQDHSGLNSFVLSKFSKPLSQLNQYEAAELAVYLRSSRFFNRDADRFNDLRDRFLKEYSRKVGNPR